MATPKPQPQQGFDTNSDQMNTKKPVIVIAGDSLLKNVQGWWVSKGMKVKTVVKAFLEPPLKTCLITSNLQSSITLKKLYFTWEQTIWRTRTLGRLLNELIYLGNFLEVESSNTKVTISNLLPRTDDPALNSEAKQVNSFLRTFANQNDWKIISHPNSTGEHLNSSGLHLNLSGTKALVSYFVSYIKNISIPNELPCH